MQFNGQMVNIFLLNYLNHYHPTQNSFIYLLESQYYTVSLDGFVFMLYLNNQKSLGEGGMERRKLLLYPNEY